MNGIEKLSGTSFDRREQASEVFEEIQKFSYAELQKKASRLRDEGCPDIITYSRKVFIPLTHLCRDVCHYCTFSKAPKKGQRAYLSKNQILNIARAGAKAGCKEALFTLGEKPELRYSIARDELTKIGHTSTISYLAEVAELVTNETGLLAHLNPGTLSYSEITKLRKVSVSQGIMLESASERLCEKGMPHFGSPDKNPAVRLKTIESSGLCGVPLTTGILIGIGETRLERIESLLAIRDLHRKHGHIQEIIIQNFRAKKNTRMSLSDEPDLEDLCWTIAVTRLIFGSEMNIQVPPNLNTGGLISLINSGINDWGGVSPVTPDFVNPESPWPHLDSLAEETAKAGKCLTERLAIYPTFVFTANRWLEAPQKKATLELSDSEGLARSDNWSPGQNQNIPSFRKNNLLLPTNKLKQIIVKARDGKFLKKNEIIALFQARGKSFDAVCKAANDCRLEINGDTVTYVVNRNINYTNICYFRCQFCAFSKGKMSENLRGRPYNLEHSEIARRVAEAWQRGATEICMQGGIHPNYTGQTYIDICHTVKQASPNIHIHAFSPLEVFQGAETLGLSVQAFLKELKNAGLGSLPGTAAEILDDEVRSIICPDKINTSEWLKVMEAAHDVGFLTTSTIMFGHIESPYHWATHLQHLRELQIRTNGFTEFVPLPFVHMESPIYLKGRARKGPTYREAILMHAVSRLVLHPHIKNIQTSWVKMGPDGVKAALKAGANDLGGTLMNETITRSAGATWGQEMPPKSMEEVISSIGRVSKQRTTLYNSVNHERVNTSLAAKPLKELAYS